MDISLTGGITAGVALLGSLIGFVGWLIRLEGKTNANLEHLVRLETDLHQSLKNFDDHRMNNDIHFSIRVNTQVEERHKQRFETLENSIKQVDVKLERKFDLLNTKLDKVLDR